MAPRQPAQSSGESWRQEKDGNHFQAANITLSCKIIITLISSAPKLDKKKYGLKTGRMRQYKRATGRQRLNHPRSESINEVEDMDVDEEKPYVSLRDVSVSETNQATRTIDFDMNNVDPNDEEFLHRFGNLTITDEKGF